MSKIALDIVKKLRKAGYQAYWAGGCVRDQLLGLMPKDYDIVTSAKPAEIEKLLEKTIPVGKQFGVVIAVRGNEHFEIATFRSEGKYTDARRPDRVFWAGAKKDAERRDFTVNALFYDPIEKKVIDYVGGQDDLKNKIIRFVGNPDERIKEDNLRLIRAIRFKNILGFEYEPKTWQAIKKNAAKIKGISAERLRDELNKILFDKNRVVAIEDLSASGILKIILPEAEAMKGVQQPDQFHKEGDVYVHTLYALRSLPKNAPLHLVWAVFLHDIGKPRTITFPKTASDRIRFNGHVVASAEIANEILRRLKFSNYEKRLIVWLVENHMIIGDIPKMRLAKQRRFLIDPRFPILLRLHKADALGSRPVDLSYYKKDLSLYEKAKDLLAEEKKRPKIKKLIDGTDLIREFNLEPGPKIGKLLKMIEIAQLEGKISKKKDALDLVKKVLKK